VPHDRRLRSAGRLGCVDLALASSVVQGSLLFPADAAIALVYVEVKMVLVRFIGSGSQHSAKSILVRLYHELGFLLCDGATEALAKRVAADNWCTVSAIVERLPYRISSSMTWPIRERVCSGLFRRASLASLWEASMLRRREFIN